MSKTVIFTLLVQGKSRDIHVAVAALNATALTSALELAMAQLDAERAPSAPLDPAAVEVESIILAGGPGQEIGVWEVDGIYTDPVGPWTDTVAAYCADGAELQGQYEMACNQLCNGRLLSVEELLDGGLKTMDGFTINYAEPDGPDIKALLASLAAAGAKMIEAYGNCGTPHQQAAATQLNDAIKAAQAALGR